jgi:hypothetical protein
MEGNHIFSVTRTCETRHSIGFGLCCAGVALGCVWGLGRWEGQAYHFKQEQ